MLQFAYIVIVWISNIFWILIPLCYISVFLLLFNFAERRIRVVLHGFIRGNILIGWFYGVAKWAKGRLVEVSFVPHVDVLHTKMAHVVLAALRLQNYLMVNIISCLLRKSIEELISRNYLTYPWTLLKYLLFRKSIVFFKTFTFERYYYLNYYWFN